MSQEHTQVTRLIDFGFNLDTGRGKGTSARWLADAINARIADVASYSETVTTSEPLKAMSE